MALRNAPIRRITPLLPLEGVPAPTQTPPVVWNFEIPHNKLFLFIKSLGIDNFLEQLGISHWTFLGIIFTVAYVFKSKYSFATLRTSSLVMALILALYRV